MSQDTFLRTVTPSRSLEPWAAFPWCEQQPPCSWNTELVLGQGRGNLLTNECLLLQTTSTALPALLRAHDRISHLHSQECCWRLDFHDCWVFTAAPISCSRSWECSAPPKLQFDQGRQAPHPGSGRRLQMQPVSFKLPPWGASVSTCSGKPIPKCGPGPWAQGCPEQGQEQAAPAKKALVAVLALLPAVKGSQSGQNVPGLGAVGPVWSQPPPIHSTTGATSWCACEGWTSWNSTETAISDLNLISKRKIW